MRVAAFVHIRRSCLDLNLTGVGKHINAMVPGLAATPGIDLSVLGAREDVEPDGSWPKTSALRGLPLTTFRWNRRLTEASWALWRWPPAERWTGPVDWVYCPAEGYVATRRARLAITVHCVNWFDPELPWYHHPDTRRQRRAFAPRFRRFRKDTTLVLPVSQFLAQRLTDLFGVPPERMRIVGNGAEDSYYSAGALDERWRQVVNDRPYLIVVGALTRRKGAEYILATARALLARRSNLQILIAGTGEPEFDAPARELSNIKMLGFVGVDTGLPALVRNSVALFFPSRYETFGIPAVEAMAAGTPAVVSHYAALPEVVGDAGVIVDPNQTEAVADVLTNLERDSQLRSKLVQAGRHRAERFRWSVCVQNVATALREFS
jgi:glycosyltransferase involved in cell wall biosynthesis